ncbi:MAG: PIN domain-containing protein [Nitrospirae bacterium]|nr:PIN domain-containing protein [Nitrospirota bacterium]
MVKHYPESFFKKHHKVYLDTSVFIYFVEQHARYYDFCVSIFKNVEEGRIEASTSTLTLLEILVQPYRFKRDDLVLKFYSLFTTYPHLSWIKLTLDISDIAARLRAEHNLRTPDAIQAASAISNSATGFICNDKAFRKIKDIECLVIDDCV